MKILCMYIKYANETTNIPNNRKKAWTNIKQKPILVSILNILLCVIILSMLTIKWNLLWNVYELSNGH